MLTYQNLVNSLLRRHGEAEISQANFSSPTASVQKLAKDAIQQSVNRIHNEIDELPFTATTASIVCTTGVSIYDIATSAKALDWDSFFLLSSDSLNVSAKPLDDMDWDEYKQYYKASDNEASTSTSYGAPLRIVRTHQNKVLVYPKPDKAYEITYVFYKYPVVLSAYNDTTQIPDRFLEVILDGGTYHMSRKRGNAQEVSINLSNFNDGIKMMKRQLQHDRVSFMRDTRTPLARTALLRNSRYI